MIEVYYHGRLGNNMFQYSFGRILAEELGYKLTIQNPDDPEHHEILEFDSVKEKIEGKEFKAPTLHLSGHQVPDFEEILSSQEQRRIFVDGYFQNYSLYKKHKNKIKKWFPIKYQNVGQSENDLVIHLRLGDNVHQEWGNHPYMMPFSFFEKCISSCDYENLYIVTEPGFEQSSYVKQFEPYNPTVISTSAYQDFCTVASFKKIVLSQSTFSWWAAFLSDAEEIYYPLPQKGESKLVNEWSDGRPDIDLTVDEPRYKYIKQSKDNWIYE